jgi:hypothetical protein
MKVIIKRPQNMRQYINILYFMSGHLARVDWEGTYLRSKVSDYQLGILDWTNSKK